MKELQADMGTAIMLITHDLGVVAQTADDASCTSGASLNTDQSGK